MNKSHSKIRHIQESNKKLEERVISEKIMKSFLKSVINESYLPNVQEGDDLCDILCRRKQAYYGSNGTVVKKIQNALAYCGFNDEKQGGGINVGCKTDFNQCDGKFKEETKKAVQDFQIEHGLKQDGSVGIETLKKLSSVCKLQLPNCDCNEKQQNSDKNGQLWYNLIGEDDPKFDDCSKIKGCLYKVLKENTSFNWSKFVECMKGTSNLITPIDKCKGCPKTYDLMPKFGINPKNESYDKGFIQKCVSNGCTKITY